MCADEATLIGDTDDEALIDSTMWDRCPFNRSWLTAFLLSPQAPYTRPRNSTCQTPSSSSSSVLKPPRISAGQLSSLNNEEVENMFSIWPHEFLGEKCTHDRVSRQNPAPIEFLRSCFSGPFSLVRGSVCWCSVEDNFMLIWLSSFTPWVITASFPVQGLYFKHYGHVPLILFY